MRQTIDKTKQTSTPTPPTTTSLKASPSAATPSKATSWSSQSNATASSRTFAAVSGQSDFGAVSRRSGSASSVAQLTTQMVPRDEGGSSGTFDANSAEAQKAKQDYAQWKSSGSGADGFASYLNRDSDSNYQSEMIQLAAKDHSLTSLVAGDNGLFNQLQTPTPNDGLNRTNFENAVQTALTDGAISVQDLASEAANQPAKYPAAWSSFINNLDATTPQMASYDSVLRLDAAQKTLTDAKEAAADADKQLQAELAKLGPALTNEQRAAYVAAYQQQPAHKDVYDKVDQAAKSLASELQTDSSTLVNAAETDSGVKDSIKAALEQLASSSQGQAALDFVHQNIYSGSGNPALHQAFADDKSEMEEKVLKPAIEQSWAHATADHNGDGAAGFDAIAGPIKDMLNDTEFGNQSAELLEGFNKAGEMVHASSGAEALNTLKGFHEGFEKLGPLGACFAGIGTAVGIAKSAVDGTQGDWGSFAKDSAMTGKDGYNFFVEATEAASKVSKGIEESLGPTAEAMSKWIPAVGAAASFVGFAVDTSRALTTDNDAERTGAAISAVGDAIAIAGNVMLATPAAPAGAVITAIGLATSAAGEVVGTLLHDKQVNDEEKTCLQAAGFTVSESQTLVNTSDEVLQDFGKMKVSPSKLLEYVDNTPDLLSSSAAVGAFALMASKFKMDGPTMEKVIDSVLYSSTGNTGSTYKQNLSDFLAGWNTALYNDQGSPGINQPYHEAPPDQRTAATLDDELGGITNAQNSEYSANQRAIWSSVMPYLDAGLQKLPAGS